MEAVARICVNSQIVKRKWDEQQGAQLKAETESFEVLLPSSAASSDPKIKTAVCKPASKKLDTKEKLSKSKQIFSDLRNYWVEYWHPREKRWICKSFEIPVGIKCFRH